MNTDNFIIILYHLFYRQWKNALNLFQLLSLVSIACLRVQAMLGVDFSYCWLNLEEQLYSLEQYIGCIWRLAFIHYCGLHQVWLEAEKSDLMKSTVVDES